MIIFQKFCHVCSRSLFNPFLGICDIYLAHIHYSNILFWFLDNISIYLAISFTENRKSFLNKSSFGNVWTTQIDPHIVCFGNWKSTVTESNNTAVNSLLKHKILTQFNRYILKYSSGSKIVKRLRRRQNDPAIIERTIGLVRSPFTALYRSFLKHCTLTNNWDYMTGLV